METKIETKAKVETKKPGCTGAMKRYEGPEQMKALYAYLEDLRAKNVLDAATYEKVVESTARDYGIEGFIDVFDCPDDCPCNTEVSEEADDEKSDNGDS